MTAVTPSVPLVALAAALFGAVVAVAAVLLVQRRRFLSDADQATYRTMHTASRASESLGQGLTPQGVAKAARYLRALLGTPAVAICDPTGVIAWDGTADHHQHDASQHAVSVLSEGATQVLGHRQVACHDAECPLRTAVIAPVVSGGKVVAALAAYGPRTSTGLVRAVEEVADWLGAQAELADLGRERTHAMEAELRALRAQISPHFIYNCLAAIASFVRTDPERARALLLDFADFTRYSFRRGGAYTTLADELGNIERYLLLEQARFGDRLAVTLTIAPEVLPVAVPFLCVQPLVENAVRHGLASKTGQGTITVTAADTGREAAISIEDDGIGSDPEVIRAALSGESDADSIGLGNVDARLRRAFGDDHGLVIETAPGAGTRVTFRVPKYAPGVSATG